jgi:2-polyprenyl-3-methyl-5-hydroxy-6-metoxy-1,4-benzoquinol methylase
VYSLFQRMLGASQVRTWFVDEVLRPRTGMRMLDIGCGPADILDHLPAVDYQGYDISEDYIERARGKYGPRGEFHCGELTSTDVAAMPPFDVVLVLGVLHHLDDSGATALLRLASNALRPGGRVITMDPVLEPGQHPIARFLVKRDRGQNVRTRDGYSALACAVFESPIVTVRHKSGIPYTHCVMECTRR